MPEVAFHVNVAEPIGYACRLLRKAVAAGARSVVVVPEPLLGQLDIELWTFAPQEFVPHCREGAAPAVLAASPAVLVERLAAPWPGRTVLVHLGTEVPQGFEVFDRLIEIVSPLDEARRQGRARWKHYAAAGLLPAVVHDAFAAAN